MSDTITQLDATRLAELIANRELSPVEVMQAHLDRGKLAVGNEFGQTGGVQLRDGVRHVGFPN